MICKISEELNVLFKKNVCFFIVINTDEEICFKKNYFIEFFNILNQEKKSLIEPKKNLFDYPSWF